SSSTSSLSTRASQYLFSLLAILLSRYKSSVLAALEQNSSSLLKSLLQTLPKSYTNNYIAKFMEEFLVTQFISPHPTTSFPSSPFSPSRHSFSSDTPIKDLMLVREFISRTNLFPLLLDYSFPPPSSPSSSSLSSSSPTYPQNAINLLFSIVE